MPKPEWSDAYVSPNPEASEDDKRFKWFVTLKIVLVITLYAFAATVAFPAVAAVAFAFFCRYGSDWADHLVLSCVLGFSILLWAAAVVTILHLLNTN